MQLLGAEERGDRQRMSTVPTDPSLSSTLFTLRLSRMGTVCWAASGRVTVQLPGKADTVGQWPGEESVSHGTDRRQVQIDTLSP